MDYLRFYLPIVTFLSRQDGSNEKDQQNKQSHPLILKKHVIENQ